MNEFETQVNRINQLRSVIENPNMPIEYANDVVNTVFNQMRHQLLEDTRQNPDFFREWLTGTRKALMEQHGNIPSNPSLCANFIVSRICQAAWDSAEKDFAAGAIPKVIYEIDYAHGTFITVSSIAIAITALRLGERSSIETVNYVEEASGRELPPAEASDIYIASVINQESAVKSLIDDPSAFQLIDKYVEEMKSYARKIRAGISPKGYIRRMHPYQVPEFVVAGSELGRDLYKLIYPLAEKLPPV